MPLSVLFASVLQLLLAATFLIIPAVGYRYGGEAQEAAQAEVERQGFSAGVLVENSVTFKENGIEIVLPVAIALLLATVAFLNLAGLSIGRTLSWILQPLVLVIGGVITGLQVFATQYIERAFKNSDDVPLREIDVRRFVDAAVASFPGWFRFAIIARFTLATAGSTLILLLLETHSSSAFFA